MAGRLKSTRDFPLPDLTRQKRSNRRRWYLERPIALLFNSNDLTHDFTIPIPFASSNNLFFLRCSGAQIS